MKILFNVMNCGLGNNGGTSTIIKSANTLQDLGHNVRILDTGRNNHTWTPLYTKHQRVNNVKEVTKADVVIATGVHTVKSTLELPERCGIKVHWIRGWETWMMSEEQIVEKVLKAPTYKIVNSKCLQNKLSQHKIKSKIIYPGYDLKQIYPLFKRNPKKIILGGLNASKKHWSTKRTEWLFETARRIKKDIPYVELWIMGNDKKPRIDVIDNYVRQPTDLQKNEFYNSIDIWMSPSKLEGLHIPPAEAMLTYCSVVGIKSEMSGTQDYLMNGKTGLLARDDLDSFSTMVQSLVIDRQLREQFGEEGYQTVKAIGDRHHNMRLLVNFLKDLI